MSDLLTRDPEINLTPFDFVRGLKMSDAEFEAKRADYHLLVRALANCVYRARKSTGGRLCDPIDFQQWLIDIAEMLR